MLDKLLEWKNTAIDYAIGLNEYEVLIRKATDSDSVDLSPEIYPEILQKFEFVDELVVRQTMQYLYARIFLTSDHHPTTVFKGLDLCRYLLFHGSHSLQEDIKSQLSSFKTLQTKFFTPSQHTKYMKKKISKLIELIENESELNEQRKMTEIIRKANNGMNSTLNTDMNENKNLFYQQSSFFSAFNAPDIKSFSNNYNIDNNDYNLHDDKTPKNIENFKFNQFERNNSTNATKLPSQQQIIDFGIAEAPKQVQNKNANGSSSGLLFSFLGETDGNALEKSKTQEGDPKELEFNALKPELDLENDLIEF